MAVLIRLGVAAAAVMAAAPAAGQAGLEYAVKANFLYKFAPFVSWPPQSFASAAALQICVAGTDPFGAVLDGAVRGQQVGGRPIVVRRTARAVEVRGCHILFVGKSRGPSTDEMLRAVAGQPVLTVTDERQRVSGGMIHFVLRSGRVRFTIDRGAASANGLEISSRLLDLAVAEGG